MWIRSRSDIIKNSIAVVAVLLVSVIGIALLAGSRAATGATLSLSSTSTSLAPGSNFSATVKVDSGSDPINTIQAALNYDATQLQFVSITEGTAFPTVAATNTNTPGVILISRASQDAPVTGSNSVVTVNFKVLAASGSVGLSFDKNFSFVVRSTDNLDVLGTITPSTFPVTGTSTASASMSLSPAAADVTAGSTVAVTVRENSGTAAVNSVQSAVTYDAAKLQFMGVTENGTFTTVTSTDSGTPGVVKVARAVPAGSSGIAGDNPIVTMNFKVLATSGSASLAIDKAQSYVKDSANTTDILAIVAGNTFTVKPTTPSVSTLSLTPSTGTYAKDSTISVVVKAASSEKLTTIQSTLNYPAGQLQYVGVTEGGVFTTAQRTNSSTPGTIDIIRSIPGGNAGVTGTNPVVTLTFKVLGSSGTAAVTFASSSALYDDKGTGTNILNLGGSTAASYTLTPNTTTPPPPPPLPGTAVMSLAPASGSYDTDGTISVDIMATSTSPLTTIQSVLNFPAAKLQYVSTTSGSVFTTAQRTNSSTPGTIDIIRSIPGGNAGVTGTNRVATVKFKVIGTSGSVPVTYGPNTAIYDDTGTGTSIFSAANSTAATYTINGAASCSANPTAPGTPAKTAATYTTVKLSWSASAAGADCTLAGYHVYRNGTAVGDVTSGTTFTDTGLTSGTSYSYTVKAFDAAGHTSATSTAASLSTTIDDMAPTTPVSVSAAATGAASINLAWDPSTDFPNPGGSGIQGYKVYRNGSVNETYTVTNGTTFTDSNVSPSTTYTYTITAYDKLGNESAPSNVVSAKTQAGAPTCSGSPSTPTGLTGGTPSLTSTSITWTASTPATDCSLAGYRVYRNTVLVGTSANTSFTDTGLQPGTSYNYTVQSYDTNGHSSALSTAQTVVTSDDTTAPSSPADVIATAVSAGQVTVSWTGSSDNLAVTAYKVFRGGSLIKTTGASDRTFSDTTVTANNDYEYTVSAVDASGNESTQARAAPSPVHTPGATDTQAPSVPAGLAKLVVTTSTAAIAWDASTDNVGVAGYHVYRNGIYIGDSTTTAYTDDGLNANTGYLYIVRAFDAAGNTSGASSELGVTTTRPTGSLVGDLNADGVVDIFDLSIMMSHWKEVSVPPRFGDLNTDETVDDADLIILLSHLGDTL